uniref:RRM domain-containing protein n=1 Tax=Oryza rufipogon TaxID=4529 RepID=A0A0E0QV65_ORYRU
MPDEPKKRTSARRARRRASAGLTKASEEEEHVVVVVPPWADLPFDLLADISRRLHATADFARFHAVCKSWRRTLPPHPPTFLPWLLSPGDATGHRTARCVFSKSSRHPAAAPIRIPTKSQLAIGYDGEPCSLYYPLIMTGGAAATTPLPSCPDEMKTWADHFFFSVSGDGTVFVYALGETYWDQYDHAYRCHFHAAILRPGDEAWMLMDRHLIVNFPYLLRDVCRVLYTDGGKMLLHNGKDYWCVVTTGAATTAGEGKWSRWWPEEPGKEIQSSHLLEYRGELLWAFVLADSGYCSDVRGCRVAGRPLASALSVSVYALEAEGGGSWVWVRKDGRSMDDRALFLGRPVSLAMDAAQLGVGRGSGCAYFVHRWAWATAAGRERCRVLRYSFGDATSEVVELLPRAVAQWWSEGGDGCIWLASPPPPAIALAPTTIEEIKERGLQVVEPNVQLMRIHVGNLPRKVDSHGLRRFLMSKHGHGHDGFVVVTDARVMCERSSRGRFSRGFGFATMAIAADAEPADVVTMLNGQILDGRPLRVKFADKDQRGSSAHHATVKRLHLRAELFLHSLLLSSRIGMFFSTFLLLFWTIYSWTVRLNRDEIGNLRINNSWDSQRYDTLDQVKEALEKVGLESSNIIIGVDFTKSNDLHHISEDSLNPYEQAISIIGKTLSTFDEDNRIPCFGFGDTSTHDQNVFSFYSGRRQYCNGVSEVLRGYREIAPRVRLSGPTSLAPIIETAMRITQDSGYQYHILLIIADGQVPRCCGANSANNRDENYLEERTLQALVQASHFPLSIVLVGVGDGPWDEQLMHCQEDRQLFDNFQFVDFTKIIMSREMPETEKEEQFALEALKKIPSQYAAIISKRIRCAFKDASSSPSSKACYFYLIIFRTGNASLV